MSMGALFYIASTTHLPASQLRDLRLHLGVEQRPKDSQGDRHRIDVEVRRRGVSIRSRQAFVLSPTANAPKSPNDSLRDALVSPFAVSGLPLRVTTFAHHDPASDKVRLMVSAQVGQPGTPKGEFTVGYLLVTDDNRIVGATSRSGRSSRPARRQRAAGLPGRRRRRAQASTRCASASSIRRGAAAASCAR
jgi:hypothetical protein